MTARKNRSDGSAEDGRRLYRKLIGPLSTDEPAEEFDHLVDNKANRFLLDHIAQRGGERGRAARARLTKWESGDSSGGDQVTDRGFTSGRRRGADPFDGPPAA